MNSKIKLLIFIGILITLMPILKFPKSFKNIILYIIGIGIILLAFSLKHSIKILRLKIKKLENQQGTLIQ